MHEFQRVTPAPVSAAATEFRVRMRDGVHLATDVYLADDPCAPVVLTRLPYDKNGVYCFIDRIARYFTEHGYHFVAQDVRGKFRSEGETLLFVNEPADGFDTIEWISQQSWCDGNVAMWGDSYFGYTQWAAVSMGHPALKAISPRVTGTQLGYPNLDQPHSRTRRVEMEVTYTYPLTHFHTNDTFEWELSRAERPLIAEIDSYCDAVGERSVSFDQWYPSPVLLERFRYGHPFDAPAIPVLHTIGWWDNIAPWSWDDHRAIARSHPDWQANEYLFIDSIDHESYWLDDAHRVEERGETELSALIPPMLDPTIEFFDVFVKRLAPASSIPRVRWNLANTTGMQESPTWPPPGTESHTLFATTTGRLAARADEAGTTLTWVHDPDDPVPSLAPNAFSYLLTNPDEAQRAERDDVLVFSADPVDHDVDLVGSVSVTATVSSTGPRMDLFAWLLDIAPDGRGTRIARGSIHLTEAQEPREVRIDLYEAGYRLQSGHHLQLHLASSDAPEFLVEPGTGVHPLAAESVVQTTQSVLVGGRAGVHVTYSVLSARAER